MKQAATILLSVSAALMISLNAMAAGNGAVLEAANTDINDKQSLKKGAQLFMDYCSGCHSIAFMRYNRIAQDLGMSKADVEKNLMFNAEKIGDPIVTSMPAE